MPRPISPKNPFPGMNPHMERIWGDTHTSLIVRIRDRLVTLLPPDLMIRAEEDVLLDGDESWDDDSTKRYRVDVPVSDRWKQGLPPQWPPGDPEGSVLLSEPQVIEIEPGEETQRWLEIRDSKGHVITAIEVLSPSNKLGKREDYQKRRDRFRQADANLVEIDLVRAGGIGVLAPVSACTDEEGHHTPYAICGERAYRKGRLEVYPCPLRKRLPAFRVPLRRTDADLPLDLQPLIDDIYLTGRYYLLDHEPPLRPPFKPDDENWVREQLISAGLLEG